VTHSTDYISHSGVSSHKLQLPFKQNQHRN